MIPDSGGKTESAKSDPGDMARVLELELLKKRADWQRANTRYRAMRTIGWFFLFVVIAGALAAFFFLFARFR